MNHQEAPASQIEKILRKWLLGQPSIRVAILFGSFAKETVRASSDIDLALALNEPFTPEIKISMLESLSGLTDRYLDLVDLNEVGEPLLNQIIQHGKMLKGTRQDYIDLSIQNVNMMQDFVPYLERLLAERRERLLYG